MVTIFWTRGSEQLVTNRPNTEFVCSPIRGGGKSSLLEHRGEAYMKNGATVLDLFGSRDSEGLAWLRSPWVKTEEKKVALIHGDDVDVRGSWDTIKVSKLTHSDLEKYDILISATGLYPSIGAEYQQVNLITDLLYSRGEGGYKKIVYTIVREASNLYYSRLRIDRNQTQAKAYMIYLIREARHMGLALGLDTLKFTSIDFDIRVLLDYIYFKGQGVIGLPDEYLWLYGFFKPQFIRAMGPSQFILLTRHGNIGLGTFPEVLWHKKEKENIMKEVGVEVDRGDAIMASKNMTRYETVDGKTHMIWMEHLATKELRKRFGVDDEQVPRLSIRKIAEKYERSASTVIDHLHKHDSQVQRNGYCSICRAAGGKVYAQIISKTPKR